MSEQVIKFTGVHTWGWVSPHFTHKIVMYCPFPHIIYMRAYCSLLVRRIWNFKGLVEILVSSCLVSSITLALIKVETKGRGQKKGECQEGGRGGRGSIIGEKTSWVKMTF